MAAGVVEVIFIFYINILVCWHLFEGYVKQNLHFK